ncbi:MAG: L-aspartate oxidase [Phycisphaerae bacterium]|nr:L-aspartate oxidase [Phycisphaerae bacterium]
MDTSAMGNLYTDCIIIGGGVAGLRAALEAAESGRVLMLIKDEIKDSNSFRAQGGIASVLNIDDSFASHIEDTLKTGCDLCDPQAVELTVRQGPAQIKQLLDWGTSFDTEAGQLEAGREGGHSHNRIIHAQGDATGRVMSSTLYDQVSQNKNITVFQHCFVIDILTDDDGCLGVLSWHKKHGFQCIWSKSTILASGGAGQLWRETTNPAGATADGVAMAYRAGAKLADMEFMQFHPTTLYIAGAARMLITEAIRGEGGKLVTAEGESFMHNYHAMGDLAPRDIVSRSIYKELSKASATNVFLDLRHLGSDWLAKRFPTISALCESFDIDVDTDLIPVRPSAHYMVGGVKTDLQGRTNIKGLYCCGEAAATGLHGANRLASNSLLEALVFGQICGKNATVDFTQGDNEIKLRRLTYQHEPSVKVELDVNDVVNSLRSIMWRNVGVEREGKRLTETLEIINFWQRYVMDKVFDTPLQWQCQNMLTVCELITKGALERKESRGVHYRTDYPEQNKKDFAMHIEF